MNHQWLGGTPVTFGGLFNFYHSYVKILYSAVQAENVLPVETLFELNAALDHLSRHWVYEESEAKVVDEAYGHFKRSCLDIFKIKVREARSQYDRLCETDISIIDNGNFEKSLYRLFAEISVQATSARQLEGQPDQSSAVPAFDLWADVYIKCQQLETEFFLNDKVKWARKKGIRNTLFQQGPAFLTGVFASIIAALLLHFLHIL